MTSLQLIYKFDAGPFNGFIVVAWHVANRLYPNTEGFWEMKKYYVFKGLLYLKSGKIPKAFIRPRYNNNYWHWCSSNQKPLEELSSRHLFQTLLEDTQTHISLLKTYPQLLSALFEKELSTAFCQAFNNNFMITV